MKQSYLTYFLTAWTLPWFISGCSIEEFPGSSGEPHGTIYVAASDDASTPVTGATVIIDGAARAERTPAFIHSVPEGMHEVVVRQFGYWNDTTQTEVVGGDTASVSLTLRPVPPDQVGRLSVRSSPPGATVLVNGGKHLIDGSPVKTPAVIELPWGVYPVSVHLAGHATVSPLFPKVTVAVDDTAEAAFTLEEGKVEISAGNLPIDFTLENVEGHSVALSDLTGQVVLVNFWYADCVPCINEFPGIEQVYRHRSAEGFHVLAVDPMYPDDREEVRRVQGELGLTFQLLLDWDRDVTGSGGYNVRTFPTNVLIDRTGTIHSVLLSVEEEQLDSLVTELLTKSD